MGYGMHHGMATMNIRSTFALDKVTVQTLARLAARWQVSKSEALRRAVAIVDEEASRADVPTPREALEWLECNPMPTAQVTAWLAENDAARRASDTDRTRRLEDSWDEPVSE